MLNQGCRTRNSGRNGECIFGLWNQEIWSQVVSWDSWSYGNSFWLFPPCCKSKYTWNILSFAPEFLLDSPHKFCILIIQDTFLFLYFDTFRFWFYLELIRTYLVQHQFLLFLLIIFSLLRQTSYVHLYLMNLHYH